MIIPPDSKVSGAVVCDHVKSLDWNERRAEFAGKAPDAILEDVRERLRPLIGL